MDLTAVWSQIEYLVEKLNKHIEKAENGSPEEYPAAAEGIKRCAAEIKRLAEVATRLSEEVANKLRYSAPQTKGSPILTMTSAPKLTLARAPCSDGGVLIDLTGEEGEAEGESKGNPNG